MNKNDFMRYVPNSILSSTIPPEFWSTTRLEIKTTAPSTHKTNPIQANQFSDRDNELNDQINDDESCFEPINFKELKKIKPKYQTNPNRFMVPILIWGPNNQVKQMVKPAKRGYPCTT
jgi:hypothetical protein